MQERLKAIKAIARNLKLRLPFEPANDNMHDLLEGIIALCDEPIDPFFGKPDNDWLKPEFAKYINEHKSHSGERIEYPGLNEEQRKELFLGDWGKQGKSAGIKWRMDVEALRLSNETTKMVSYLMNDKWLSIGIPKKQPLHEQVFWAANKGATKIKMSHEGQETEIEIFQYKES